MRVYVLPTAIPLLLLFLISPSHGQDSRASMAPRLGTSTPTLQVDTENPPAVNLGKPAVFTIRVKNTGSVPATGVVIATKIPTHVDLDESKPKATSVDDRTYHFLIGDLQPGQTQLVSLVLRPQSTAPIQLDTTTIFAASTRSSAVVQRPLLEVSPRAPQIVEVGESVNVVLCVSNVGDGDITEVVLTPSLTKGNVDGTGFSKAVPVGTIPAGESREVRLSATAIARGLLLGKYEASNPDGVTATGLSQTQVVQPELKISATGPRVRPLAREAVYEIRVTNPGDAVARSTEVVAALPAGLTVTHIEDGGQKDAQTGTLSWNLTGVSPGRDAIVRFRAETSREGEQKLLVAARAKRVPDTTASVLTLVISRPNLIATVLNDAELAAVGESMNFQLVVVNAGSKAANDVTIRVAIPAALEATQMPGYQVQGSEILFPAQQIAAGEKVKLSFRAIGKKVGDHRVRVSVDSQILGSEIAVEGIAF
ncbi:MAG TPA: CARDB domain-containing protein, partial [Pirellulaceae bacterium]|nr:CARDB domain-containing protein [Pirellulaceae bacterium]